MALIKSVVLATSQKGKGGIASVIKIHKKYKPELKFISTTPGKGGVFMKLYYFVVANISFITLLLFSKIDIVHIHAASRNSFNRKYVFFRIAELFKKKVIFQIHGAEFHLFFENASKRQKEKIYYVLENSDGVICLSKEWRIFFEKHFNIKNIFILNNVVDYAANIRKRSYALPIYFLFLGYIDKRKGIWDLLEVIKDNKEVFKDKLKLKVGGNGQKEKLISFIEDHKLQELIEYIGWVDSTRKDECLCSSDVYILPSYNEGLPISVLEAMSNGMPIISTNVGGIPNVVLNLKNGFLIEPGDKLALFNSINYFILNNEKIESMSNKSIELVKDYLPNQVIEDLNKIYHAVLYNT